MQLARLNRRQLITLVGGAAVAWPKAARAQPAARMQRIGVLTSFGETDPEGQAIVALVREVLEKSGWIEGRNVQTLVRWAGSGEDIAGHAKDIVNFSPDVILASPTRALLPLVKEARSIPIVFAEVSSFTGNRDQLGAPRRQRHGLLQSGIFSGWKVPANAQGDGARGVTGRTDHKCGEWFRSHLFPRLRRAYEVTRDRTDQSAVS